MQKFLRQLTSILKQNEVFHSAEMYEQAGKVQPSAIDTYTVYLFEEKSQPKKTRKTKATEDNTKQNAVIEATPLIQIKYSPALYNLSIFINQTQVYNFGNFKHKGARISFVKDDKSDTQQTLDNILDICIKKSDQIHLEQLRQIKKILRDSRTK